VAAERIRQRPAAVRDVVVAALDEWDTLARKPELKITEPHREWLREVLEAAEPQDGWGRYVRVARRETDPARRQAALEGLAKSTDVARVSAQALTRLAGQLRPTQQAELLRRAQRHYPADFWVNHDLGWVLNQVRPAERQEAVRFLTAAVAVRPESPGAHLNLGYALKVNGQVDAAIASYQKALDLDPKYAWAHGGLGNALMVKGQVDEAIAHYKKAIDLHPKSARTHNQLALALWRKGQLDAAIANLRKAIELDPKLAQPHDNLGAIFCDEKRDYDAAIACFRQAIALDSKNAGTHCNLGHALSGKGQWDAAIASYREAALLDPKYARALHNLGNALFRKGQWDAAIASCRNAIALDPKYPESQLTLGTALAAKGRMDEAIACYRKAIALDPKYADAHCNLGHALRSQGRFTDALAALKRGHELGTKQPGWRYPSAAWVRQAESLAALEAKLPAFLEGEYQPRGMAERLGLVAVCRARKLHHARTRLYADAFAADPRLADDLKAGRRYKAACSAALASAGQGEDTARLDDKERTRLRKQALDWLEADLAMCGKLLESGPPQTRPFLVQVLSHWQKDSDLAGLRDKAALDKLSAEERAACAKLWVDVAALMKKAEEKAK
jgi:tetratricopeptide (TPR) repeat protein